MKKILIFAFLALFTFNVYAISATVESIKSTKGGVAKAEYLLKETDTEWKELKVGMTLPEGAVVFSKFATQVTLKIGESTVIATSLTKVVIARITETDRDVVLLQLDAGSLKNDVKSKKNVAIDYQVRTTAVTCSVRGTNFDVDANGNVDVNEGKVWVSDYENCIFIMCSTGEVYRPSEQSHMEIWNSTKGDDPTPVTGFNDPSGLGNYEESLYHSNITISIE